MASWLSSTYTAELPQGAAPDPACHRHELRRESISSRAVKTNSHAMHLALAGSVHSWLHLIYS